jgi:hypothetical protein
MSKREPYSMTSPCPSCPFRTDIPAYLTAARVREIQQGLIRSEFPCHKTTRHETDDDGGEHYIPTGAEVHCAGALILLEKIGQPSQMMRIAERLGMYDAGKLKMDAPVFDTFGEMIAAQKRRRGGA